MTPTTQEGRIAFIRQRNEALKNQPKPVKAPVLGLGLEKLVLEVAATFPGPFTIEQLAVQAWMADPVRFGMTGFTKEYPDNNRMGATVYGKSRLIGKGFIARCKDGLRVTDAGLIALKEVQQ